jgi:hypothetical protein
MIDKKKIQKFLKMVPPGPYKVSKNVDLGDGLNLSAYKTSEFIRVYTPTWGGVAGSGRITKGQRDSMASLLCELLNCADEICAEGVCVDESEFVEPSPLIAVPQAWDVYLGKKNIDTVFYHAAYKKAEVLTGLIEHDGYHPSITVKKRREKK